MGVLRKKRRSLVVLAIAIGAIAVLLVLVMAFVACGPPASFDGLVGGPLPPIEAGADADAGVTPPIELRPDDTLPPPHLIGPSSGTWVNSARPHFRWKHSIVGVIGARLELCRTRACTSMESTDMKVFEAGGTELTVPEDLAPGIWFWRLYSKTADTFGTKPSVTWELLVRGGKGSDFPTGSFFDFNGDGRPDLIATIEYEGPPPGPSPNVANIIVLVGTSDDLSSYAADVDGGAGPFGVPLFLPDTSLGIGDFDGDGFIDVAFHDQFQTEARKIFVAAGSLNGLDMTKVDRITKIPLEEAPILASGGDFDGDGYSDLVASTKNEAYAVYGSDAGLGSFAFAYQVDPLPPDAGGATLPTKALAAAGVFDQNADGIGDIALTDPYSYLPALFVLGSAQRSNFTFFAPEIVTTPMPKGADPIVLGDFDGDGHPDIAFATTVASKPAVCVQLASEPVTATKLTCWVPEPPPAGFGASMIVADVDPDDRDDIIVGSASGGIDILRLKPEGLVAQHIASAFGVQLTTLSPGRPKPAVWAALREDGSALAIFKGAQQAVPTIAPPSGALRFGKRLR